MQAANRCRWWAQLLDDGAIPGLSGLLRYRHSQIRHDASAELQGLSGGNRDIEVPHQPPTILCPIGVEAQVLRGVLRSYTDPHIIIARYRSRQQGTG